MARLWSCGFELQSATAAVEFEAVSGVPTISTTTKRGGLASLRFNTAASEIFVTHTYDVTAQTDDIWARAYIYIASAPNVQISILLFRDVTSGNICNIRMNTDRTLELWDEQGGVQRGSDSSAIPLNTWTRVELAYLRGTDDTCVGYIDGVSFASGATGVNKDANILRFGILGSSTADIYFDDIAVNDSGGTAENSLPGEGQIVHMQPDASGDNAATFGTFADIDEITPDDTNTFIDLDTATTIADYNCESSSNAGIGSSDTIKVVEVGVRIREEVSTVTSYQLRLKSAASGTTSTSTASDAGNTTWRTNPTGTTSFTHRLVSYTDPTTGVAWTPTGTNSLDNMQIGVASLDADDIDVSTLWALVEHIPGSAAASAFLQRRMVMGVGM